MSLMLPDNAIQIGENQYYSWVSGQGNNRIGIIEWHYDLQKPNIWCAGFVGFEGLVPKEYGLRESWKVISYDPLELEPSLLCKKCGNHGYIRNGLWVKV